MSARVLIATETYAPEVGGGETQARALAEGLVARGFQVRLLTRRSRAGSPRSEELGGVCVERLPPTGPGQGKKWLLLLPLVLALLMVGLLVFLGHSNVGALIGYGISVWAGVTTLLEFWAAIRVRVRSKKENLLISHVLKVPVG